MNPPSQPLERFAGSTLPAWNWYWTERHAYLGSTTRTRSRPEPFIHTLLFATHTSHLLLGRKKRGFGATTYNGIGGKITPHEPPLQCILRETHEEIGVHLPEEAIHFAGRISITVDGGERIRIAVYTAVFDQRMRERVKASEEVEPRWVDVGDVMRGADWERLPERMRPEHRIYLGVLLLHLVRGQGNVLIDVSVDFDVEPTKEELGEGEGPENHRTVRRWSLDVLPSSAADSIAE